MNSPVPMPLAGILSVAFRSPVGVVFALLHCTGITAFLQSFFRKFGDLSAVELAYRLNYRSLQHPSTDASVDRDERALPPRSRSRCSALRTPRRFPRR